MSEETCATIKVRDANVPGGFIVINEADYDPKVHKKLTGKEEDAIAQGAISELEEKPKAKK